MLCQASLSSQKFKTTFNDSVLVGQESSKLSVETNIDSRLIGAIVEFRPSMNSNHFVDYSVKMYEVIDNEYHWGSGTGKIDITKSDVVSKLPIANGPSDLDALIAIDCNFL